MVVGIVRVVARDVGCPLLAASAVNQHEVLSEPEVDRFLPITDGALQRPQCSGKGDVLVGPCAREQVLVVPGNLPRAPECGAGQALGSDPQVVSDVADVRAGSPLQVGVALSAVRAGEEVRVNRWNRCHQLHRLPGRDRPVVTALTTRVAVQRSAPIFHHLSIHLPDTVGATWPTRVSPPRADRSAILSAAVLLPEPVTP